MDYKFIKKQLKKTIFSINYLLLIMSFSMIQLASYYVRLTHNLTDLWLKLIILSGLIYWVLEFLTYFLRTVRQIDNLEQKINSLNKPKLYYKD